MSLAEGQKVIFEAKMGPMASRRRHSTGVTRQATAVREDRRAKPRITTGQTDASSHLSRLHH